MTRLCDCHGPYTTCCNRFNRWRKAGIRDDVLAVMTGGRDAGPETRICEYHLEMV